MAMLPAICDNCKNVFPSLLHLGNGVTGIGLSGNKAGPCPNCGSYGSVPDGVYDVMDDVISLTTDYDSKQIEEALKFIKNLSISSTFQEVKEEIEEQFGVNSEFSNLFISIFSKIGNIETAKKIMMYFLVATVGYGFNEGLDYMKEQTTYTQEEQVNDKLDNISAKQSQSLKNDQSIERRLQYLERKSEVKPKPKASYKKKKRK